MTGISRFSVLTPSIAAMLLACMGLGGCNKSDKATVMSPLRVKVEVIGNNTSQLSDKTYSGTVESAEASTVSFSVPGTIKKIYVDVGQKINKGQLLATVKSESLVNAGNIAQAELAQAQDAYRRLKKLHDANALPDIKWVEVQQKLKQAENAAAIANRTVHDASIYSPISGYVSEKLAEDGQTVIAAQPVLSIVNLGDMRVSIPVPEEDIAGFNNGSSCIVRLDALDSLTVNGSFEQKAVVADPLTRSYSVKFRIPNPEGKILPGMIASVMINHPTADSVATRTPSIQLPSQAVLLDADNRQFVWVVRGGKATRRFVKAEELSTDGVYIQSGLSQGDSVIVAGMQKIGTGTKVTAK